MSCLTDPRATAKSQSCGFIICSTPVLNIRKMFEEMSGRPCICILQGIFICVLADTKQDKAQGVPAQPKTQ